GINNLPPDYEYVHLHSLPLPLRETPCRRSSPLPLREREGPVAQQWEGEGALSGRPLRVDHIDRTSPLARPSLSRWAPSSPARGEEAHAMTRYVIIGAGPAGMRA